MPTEASEPGLLTIPFDQFWSWLKAHRNCVVRAGTPYAMLMDHDDYHWDVLSEPGDTQILQLVRGKDLVGEIIVLAAEIAYVQRPETDGDDQVFECVVETPHAQEVAYYFVMAHDYEEESTPSRSWTH